MIWIINGRLKKSSNHSEERQERSNAAPLCLCIIDRFKWLIWLRYTVRMATGSSSHIFPSHIRNACIKCKPWKRAAAAVNWKTKNSTHAHTHTRRSNECMRWRGQFISALRMHWAVLRCGWFRTVFCNRFDHSKPRKWMQKLKSIETIF